MSDHPDVIDAQASVRNRTQDPITKMLLADSQLTAIQMETLLTDALSADVDLRKSQRRLYRPSKSRISRGAYNRTLIQAQNNVIRSIYTILLLGYLGLFDSAALQPFLELSDTIDSYVQETKISSAGDHSAIDQLKERLLESVSALASRRSFKDTL